MHRWVLAVLSMYTARVFAERLGNTLQPVECYSTPIISTNRLEILANRGKTESNFAIKENHFCHLFC